MKHRSYRYIHAHLRWRESIKALVYNIHYTHSLLHLKWINVIVYWIKRRETKYGRDNQKTNKKNYYVIGERNKKYICIKCCSEYTIPSAFFQVFFYTHYHQWQMIYFLDHYITLPSSDLIYVLLFQYVKVNIITSILLAECFFV